MLSYFRATEVKNFFSTQFKRLNGVAQLANIDQLNTLVDAINALNSNREISFVYRITETLGVANLTLAKMSGAGVVNSSCTCAYCSGTENPACSGCTGVNTSSFYKCSSTSAALTRTAPGVYELTLAPDFTYNDIVVKFGNIGFTGAIINVVRTSNVLYTIRVTNAATGVAIDGELTNTPLEITIWQ